MIEDFLFRLLLCDVNRGWVNSLGNLFQMSMEEVFPSFVHVRLAKVKWKWNPSIHLTAFQSLNRGSTEDCFMNYVTSSLSRFKFNGPVPEPTSICDPIRQARSSVWCYSIPQASINWFRLDSHRKPDGFRRLSQLWTRIFGDVSHIKRHLEYVIRGRVWKIMQDRKIYSQQLFPLQLIRLKLPRSAWKSNFNENP